MIENRASKEALFLAGIILISAFLPVASGEPEKNPATVSRADEFFHSKIEPLLRAQCYECHSHGGKMKAGLALDSRSGWEKGGDSGPAVVPFHPEKSLLLRMVRWSDEDHQMPPKQKLAEAEIKLLAQWVKQGAPDPRTLERKQEHSLDWWSLKPLKQPRPPQGGHPIDAFIRAKLAAQGLSPSPEGKRGILIRRLTYNLHGLPPTPREADKFVNDQRNDAYLHLVDRLLDSPRYGERWVRHWLDTIHFADTHGCEHDKERPNAWRFRDYVINRLNDDVPWERFIREQLAADVFYPEDSQLTPALGFIGAGPLELSRKTTAPVTFAYLDRDNMVTQTMAAFAGATANCARCHDHKFDPISREDYYSLQAIFAGVDKADTSFDPDKGTGTQRKKLTALLQAVKEQDSAILLQEQAQGMSQSWWANHKTGVTAWYWLKPDGLTAAASDTTLTLIDDGSIVAGGKPPLTDTYTITARTALQSLTAIRVDVLPHESLPMKGPGRAVNGNFHLNEFTCELLNPGAREGVKLAFGSATADYEQWGSWTAAAALDGKPKTAWAIHPKVGQPHHAVFVLKQPVEMPAGSRLKVTLKQVHGGSHIIGRFKLSASDGPQERVVIVPEDVLAAWRIPEENRNETQQLALIGHAVKQIAGEKLAALPPQAQVFAVNKKAKVLPVNLLKRGNIDKPEKLARPGALSLISPLEGRFELTQPENEASRRAALAAWLAHPENPLTWRCIVNRVWHYHFGQGICDTPNDLGRMGGIPSHPDLLDWLAIWFRDEAKGSLKALHRLIVTSAAYRQQSASRPDAAKVDSGNRLLWRMNRLRLDAEQYRDSLRQVSGRLDLSMGGPGVKHFVQKKGVHDTPVLDYRSYDWNRPDAMRRSIYRIVWRGIPDPFMEAMDFPNLGLLAPRRGQTISPLQSLVLFNHDFVLFHSKHLAAAMQETEPATPESVVEVYRLVYQRTPTPDEQSELLDYASTHGLAAMCRLLFNSNAFMFVE